MEKTNIIQQLITDHPEALSDRKMLNALLLDYFPNEKLTCNTLLMVYDEGFLNEMMSSKNIDSLVYNRYISTLIKDYGIDRKLAEEAIELWASALKVGMGKSIAETRNIPNSTDNAIGSNSETIYQNALVLMNNNRFANAAYSFKKLNNYKDSNNILNSIPNTTKRYIIRQADTQMITRDTADKASQYFQVAIDNIDTLTTKISGALKVNQDLGKFEGSIGAEQLIDYIDEYCIPSLVNLYSLSDTTLFSNETNSCIDEGKDTFKELAKKFWDISEEIESFEGTTKRGWSNRTNYEILRSIVDISEPWAISIKKLMGH